jgi:hypothetical protein
MSARFENADTGIGAGKPPHLAALLLAYYAADGRLV